MVYGRYIYPAGLKDIRGLRLITVKRSFFISHVQLCDLMDCRTPASLSFTISRCLLKLMSVELVMPSNHLIPCCPFSSCLLSFPASGSFLASQLFTSGGQSIGASASVLSVNEPSGLISFRIERFDLLAVQGTLKSLL